MTPVKLRERFARLLSGYSSLVANEHGEGEPLTPRFRSLLEQFVHLRQITDAADHADAADSHERFHRLLDEFVRVRQRVDVAELAEAGETRRHLDTLLAGYHEATARYRERQVDVADDFNLLDVMELTGKEVRHSMMLAWLLDHDLRRFGTHAQGNLGFRLFLHEFRELGLPSEYAECKYWVNREVAGDESIVDVEVACRGRFIIHIENKIWSSEGTDQTDREWSDLQRRAAELDVPSENIHPLYLTPHGMQATNANFRAIAWRRVVRVLEKFADEAKPADVQLFARHYAKALKRFVVFQDINEDDHGEATIE